MINTDWSSIFKFFYYIHMFTFVVFQCIKFRMIATRFLFTKRHAAPTKFTRQKSRLRLLFVTARGIRRDNSTGRLVFIKIYNTGNFKEKIFFFFYLYIEREYKTISQTSCKGKPSSE